MTTSHNNSFHVKQDSPPGTTSEAGFSVFPTAAELARLRERIGGGEERFKQLVGANPLESLLALVGGGALVYYLAERGKNKRVKNLADAVEFTTTCASVGYSNIFPETAVGSLVASVIFLFGPALTAQALEPAGGRGQVPPVGSPAAAAPDTAEILKRLDAIVELLGRGQTKTAGK